MNKAHILEEIRRTAQENGGVPLGFRKFASETGIKREDWLGKYWARWSEAVREAGFVPNQLTAAYSETMLLDRYASLARELGRLPTAADLKLKAHNDPDFPHDKTFSRLGSKAQLIRQLAERCRGVTGYDDVLRMCEAYSPPIRDADEEANSDEVEIGFVYLIRSGRFYKIGKTNAAGRREYELGIQLPERATTVHVIRTDDPTGIEAYWHRRFEAKRKNGEWFELTAADTAAFKRRSFM